MTLQWVSKRESKRDKCLIVMILWVWETPLDIMCIKDAWWDIDGSLTSFPRCCSCTPDLICKWNQTNWPYKLKSYSLEQYNWVYFEDLHFVFLNQTQFKMFVFWNANKYCGGVKSCIKWTWKAAHPHIKAGHYHDIILLLWSETTLYIVIWYIVMLWCGMLSSPGVKGCITVKWKGFSEPTRLLYF